MGGEFQINESIWESRPLTSWNACSWNAWSTPNPSLSFQYALYLSGPGDASKPQSQAQAFVPPLLCFWETVFAWSFVLLVPTYSSGYTVSITTLLYTKVKVKVAQSCLVLICLYIQKVNVTRYNDSESRWVMSDSLLPMDYGILQARILGWVAFPFSRVSSQPRDWTQVSCNAGRFFTAEPQRKPKHTGVGSLSFLQQILPI